VVAHVHDHCFELVARLLGQFPFKVFEDLDLVRFPFRFRAILLGDRKVLGHRRKPTHVVILQPILRWFLIFGNQIAIHDPVDHEIRITPDRRSEMQIVLLPQSVVAVW